MTTLIEKILARKNQTAKIVATPPPSTTPVSPAAPAGPADPSSPAPCPSCGSAIRWLNAAGVARCPGCQPPKFAALVRSREILATDQAAGVSRWEQLIELPDGRLASASVLATLTAADGGGGVVAGEGDQAGGRFVEIDPDAYFKPAEFFRDYLANDRKLFGKPGSAKLRDERRQNPASKKQAATKQAEKQKLIQ